MFSRQCLWLHDCNNERWQMKSVSVLHPICQTGYPSSSLTHKMKPLEQHLHNKTIHQKPPEYQNKQMDGKVRFKHKLVHIWYRWIYLGFNFNGASTSTKRHQMAEAGSAVPSNSQNSGWSFLDNEDGLCCLSLWHVSHSPNNTAECSYSTVKDFLLIHMDLELLSFSHIEEFSSINCLFKVMSQDLV